MVINSNDFNIVKFKEYIIDKINDIKKMSQDDIVKYVEEELKELSSMDSVIVLFDENKSDNNYEYVSPSLGKKIGKCKESSILVDVVEKKQPLLVKDVEKSLLFNEKCDNLQEKKIRDLMIIPVFLKKTGSRYPEVLVWGATNQTSNAFIDQKTVLYLIKFLDAVKPYILNIDIKSLSYDLLSLEQCLEKNETLEYDIQRNKQYFHSIIHDIRTPMNALQGFLELLSINETDETKKDYLDSAIKSSQHMIRLISDALDIAKIENGSLPMEKQPFNPQIELSEIIRIFYETARKKGIYLGAYFDPELPEHIVSDVYRIKQVLSNLLSNAIKFTSDNGSILVELVYNKDKDIITISVEDSGIGISKDSQKSIFMPYVQESNSTERVYGGTGLGLSISNQIVTMLGGKLDLISEEGEGSKFFFSLPAQTPKNEKPFIDSSKITAYNIFLYNWKNREDIRSKLVQRYLDAFGINYKAGEKGLTEVIYSKYDVIVIEKQFLALSEYERVQKLLDEGKKVLWLEDQFDNDYKWFKGDIVKIPYPLISYTLADALSNIKTKEIDHKNNFDSSAFPGVKAIIVDDNRINIKLMEQVFKRLQMKSVSFMDPKPAIELLEKSRYDIIFIDENMPKMRGSEAIKIIRKKEKKKKISPVVIISLSGDTDHQKEILAAGADEVMTKPIELDELSNVLSKYFSNKN